VKLKRFPIALTILVAFFFLGAAYNAAAPPQAVATPSSTFKSPSGKTYTVTHLGNGDNHEPLIAPAIRNAAGGDNFAGSARMAAKLSIASGTAKTFTDIGQVLSSVKPDAQMRAKNISKGPDSGRLPEEQGVVTVTAWLYASSKESDNDFHCIMGRDPSKPAQFMNVEVSALPPSSSEFLAALQAARNQFKTFFTSNGDVLPSGGYDKFDPPIPVKITGSLFFDVDHVPPAVGPTGMKPKSAWEIHPVTDIQFEP
jgi:hypothetical protein